jgi:hypothetical protein
MHPGHKLHLSLTVEQGQPELIAPKPFGKDHKENATVTKKAKDGVITYDLVAPKDNLYGFNTSVQVVIRCPEECAYNFFYSSTDAAIELFEGQLVSAVLTNSQPLMSFEYFPDREGEAYVRFIYTD